MSRKARKRLAVVTLLDLAAGAVVVAAASAPAVAQTRPAVSWTGFYYGAHVGYRTIDADFLAPGYNAAVAVGAVTPIPGLRHGFDNSGGIGGFHAGYNWQFVPNWLWGLEADWSWGRNKNNLTTSGRGIDLSGDAFTFVRSSELNVTWQATIRTRAGFVVESTLWYLTGGVAFQHAKWQDITTINTIAPVAVGYANWTARDTLVGWVIGAGVEQFLTPNFTWRLEYLYENFDGISVPHGFSALPVNLGLDEVHKVRVGFTFKP